MAAKDRAIVLDVSLNTQEAQKAMQQMAKTTKQFANTLSHSTRPSRELQQSFKDLNKVALDYGKTLSKLENSSMLKGRVTSKLGQSFAKQEADATKNLIDSSSKYYELLDKLKIAEATLNNKRLAAVKARERDNEANKDEIAGIQAKISRYKELLDQYEKEADLRKAKSKETNAGFTNELKGLDIGARKALVQNAYDEQLEKLNLVQNSLNSAEISYEKQKNTVASLNKQIDDTAAKVKKYQDILNNIDEKRNDAFGSALGNIDDENEESIQRLIASYQEYLDLLKKTRNQVVFDNIKKAVNTLIADFKKLIQSISKFLSYVGRISGLKSVFRHFNPLGDDDGTNWKKAIRYVIQYGLGFRSLFFLVRKLRTTFVSALEDMGKSIPQVQKSLDSLSVSMNTMRGGLAVAFAPLLKYVAALMERLAAVAISAANAIAQFFAVITGQKTWYKLTKGVSGYTDATKGSTKATKENEKEMKKQLAAFDDIDVLVQDLNDDLDDVGGGGGGGADLSEMGVWQAMANASSELADLIKEAWASDDVLHAFETVGRYIGEALEKALDRLLTDFWPPIRALAEKVALALAGTINGFFQTNAVISLAKNIAAGINTAFSAAANFWKGVQWGAMAKKLRDSIETLIDQVEWDTIARYFNSKIKGIIEFAFNLIGDGGWILKLANKVTTTFNNVFKDVDIKKLGKTINTGITSLLEGAKLFLDTNHDLIVEKITEFLEGLKLDEILHSLWEVIVSGVKLLWDTAIESLKQEGWLSSLLWGWLALELGKLSFLSLAELFIVPQLTTALSTILGTGSAVATTVETGGAALGASLGASFIAGLPVVSMIAGTIGAFSLVYNSLEEHARQKVDEDWGWAANMTGLNPDSTGAGGFWDLVFGSTPEKSGETMGESGRQVVNRAMTSMGQAVDEHGGILKSRAASISAEINANAARSEQELVNGVVQTLTNMGYDLSGFTGSTLAELEAFTSSIGLSATLLQTTVEETNANIQQNVTDTMTEVETVTNESTQNIQTYTEDTATKATEQEVIFGKAFDKMAEDVADAASAIASSPIKPIIDTSSIDAGISKLNTFLSLAARAGSVNVNVSNVSIPKMASGGVIPPNKPFLAMLGDQTRGTNVEAPLDTIVTAMKEALGSTNYRASTGEVVLQLDGVTLARATVPYELDELNRKGYNVKVLEK